MKKKFKFTMVIALLLAFVASSCKKDDNNESGDLSGLKAITFPENTEEVLETKTLKELGNGKKEVLQLVKKSMLVDPVNVVESSKLEEIYPGSILRGDSFMEGNIDPITVNHPQEAVFHITSTNNREVHTKTTTIPSASNLRKEVNNLLLNNSNFQFNPKNLVYNSHSVDTYGSFNKGFKTHSNLNALVELINKDLLYETSELSINQTKYVLVKIQQEIYNISVVPKLYNEWGELNRSNIGSYEPLYISEVSYGRAVHLLIKTDKSANEINDQVSNSINNNWYNIKTGGRILESDLTNKMFLAGDITTMGSDAALKKLRELSVIIHFFQGVSKENDLIKYAVPISYKVRSLKDNKLINVYSFYTEKKQLTL